MVLLPWCHIWLCVFGEMSIWSVYFCRQDCPGCLTNSAFAAKGGEHEGWPGGFSACWTGGFRNQVPRCMQVVWQTESPQQPQPDCTTGTHVSGVHWLKPIHSTASALYPSCAQRLCLRGELCFYILVTKLSCNTSHHQPFLSLTSLFCGLNMRPPFFGGRFQLLVYWLI